MTQINIKKDHLDYIEVLRVLATFVVVAFHTYGYMYANHFPQSAEKYRNLYYILNQCVFINVAMPLFTAISGFLFAWLYQQGKYQDYWQMIQKKALRLLLPFFVFGTLMMATTGVPFRPWLLYTGSISHLWYLTALFWCFALGGLVQRFLTCLWGVGGYSCCSCFSEILFMTALCLYWESNTSSVNMFGFFRGKYLQLTMCPYSILSINGICLFRCLCLLQCFHVFILIHMIPNISVLI